MNELIPIQVNNGKRVVDARVLHDFLGSKRDFSNWIKDRIDKCDLIENQDFVVFTKFGENLSGGRPSKEYALTIDAAKEISMIEGNEIGKKARRYFIEVEKAYKNEIISLPDFSNPAEAARAWADQYEKAKQQTERAITAEKEVVALSKEIESMQPKISYYDKILDSKDAIVTTQVAQDYGLSAKKFNIMLRNFGIQRKVNGQWILYGKYLSNGYVQSKCISILRHNGRSETKMLSAWTQKGRLFLYEELKRRNVIPLIER